MYDGWQYMLGLNYDEPARICLTHSFNLKGLENYIGRHDVTAEEESRIAAALDALEFDDYDRLMQFVSKACIMTCHDGACSDTAGAENKVRQALEADPDRYLVDVCADMTKIYKQTAGGACKIMDLWVYDFYKDDYPIADHMSYLARMAEKRALIKNRRAQVAFLQKEIQNNAAVSREQTTNLFPGLDNWGGYPGLKHADRWIPTEAILPFKKVKFENRLFLAPARADVLLGYEYPDYMELPYDIGLQSHADDT